MQFWFLREKNDPFAVENLDSNNVLEAEIEAISAKAATGDLASVMRKGALETKLLVSWSRAERTLSFFILVVIRQTSKKQVVNGCPRLDCECCFVAFFSVRSVRFFLCRCCDVRGWCLRNGGVILLLLAIAPSAPLMAPPLCSSSSFVVQMLVSAVQSGELDLKAYCDILRERVIRDKVKKWPTTRKGFPSAIDRPSV